MAGGDKRFVIRFSDRGMYRYLTPKANRYNNYTSQYFKFNHNNACKYKLLKNAFNRINKLIIKDLYNFEIVEVTILKNGLIFTENVISYKQLQLGMKISKLKKLIF